MVRARTVTRFGVKPKIRVRMRRGLAKVQDDSCQLSHQTNILMVIKLRFLD